MIQNNRKNFRLLNSAACLMIGSLLIGGSVWADTPKPLTTSLHTPEQARLQIAILLDTSNSMDGLIDQTKDQIWTLVNELSEGKKFGREPLIELALYEYGNSDNSISKGYIRQVQSLTTDLDAVSESLFSLDTNGGQEYAGQAISTALNGLEWSDNHHDLKLMIVAGNEPFTQGPVKYQTACAHARDHDIVIDTIHCGGEQRGAQTGWKDGAECSGGLYMTINQDEKSVFIPTPYDDEILRLNKDLNTTYYGYGSQGREKKQRQIMQDSNASAMSPKAEISRSQSKAGTAYKNESWDIVDGYEEEPSKIMALPSEQLPDELKGKSKAEIKTFVEAEATKRKVLKDKINALSAKQKEFTAKKRAELSTNKTLDTIMVDTIRKQAIKNGFIF